MRVCWGLVWDLCVGYVSFGVAWVWFELCGV